MSRARKELAWCIKKNLYKLSDSEVYQLARDIATDSHYEEDLDSTDEEGCMNHIVSYIQSDSLLESEDEGMSQLLALNDLVCSMIANHDSVAITTGITQSHDTDTFTLPVRTADQTIHSPDTAVSITKSCTTPKHIPPQPNSLMTDNNATAQTVDQLQVMHDELGKKLQHYKEVASRHPASKHYSESESPTRPLQSYTLPQERMVSLKDLSYLQRREFKVHGGQVGDQISDITYSSICKQIGEGIREGFTEAEVIRGVLKIVKPGVFKDMLMNKEEISVSEMKGFLRSHLGEKASTELFQELMCAKQNEHEPPQQFLYRMIGLKQKILFQSRQNNTDICYDYKTIQEVFLHSIYQGLGSKHADIRQQLRPLLSNSQVTDEEILSHVMKIISDENEHQRRLGHSHRHKTTHANYVEVENGGEPVNRKESQIVQQLSTQVETLTKMVASLMNQQAANIQTTYPKTAPVQPPNHTHVVTPPHPGNSAPLPPSQLPVTRRGKISSCNNCTQQGAENCNHCFVCGDSGHRAVGCLRRSKQSGNGNWSLLRDNQRSFHSSSPTQ